MSLRPGPGRKSPLRWFLHPLRTVLRLRWSLRRRLCRLRRRFLRLWSHLLRLRLRFLSLGRLRLLLLGPRIRFRRQLRRPLLRRLVSVGSRCLLFLRSRLRRERFPLGRLWSCHCLPLLRIRPRPPRPWQGSERGGWGFLPPGPNPFRAFERTDGVQDLERTDGVQCGVGCCPCAGLPRLDRSASPGSPGLRGSGSAAAPFLRVTASAQVDEGNLHEPEVDEGSLHPGRRC